MSKDLEIWLKGRPEIVKAMARRYPPGTRFELRGQLVHVIGYREDGGLYISSTNPADNYQEAVATRVPLCGCCLGKIHRVT